jgi:hypothetical protein
MFQMPQSFVGFLLDQLYNSSSKGVTLFNCDEINVIGYLLRDVGTTPNIMKQTLNTEFFGLSLYKNNFISHSTISTMKRLIEAGIPQRSYNFFYKFLIDPHLPPEDKSPHAFTLDDLGFGFIIWLYACAICCSVFILELLYFCMKSGILNFARTAAGLYCLHKLFKERHFIM